MSPTLPALPGVELGVLVNVVGLVALVDKVGFKGLVRLEERAGFEVVSDFKGLADFEVDTTRLEGLVVVTLDALGICP